MRRIVVGTLTRLPSPAQRAEPVMWPRYVPDGRGGRKLAMTAIDPRSIPPGWQAISVRVPMRLASCEEVECPFYLNGWTEVLPADGTRHTRPGKVTADQAANTFGRYGPRELVPNVIHHPPGTTCPGDAADQDDGQLSARAHKVPSGLPPVYSVDGRIVLWNQFEDAIGGGLHRAKQLAG